MNGSIWWWIQWEIWLIYNSYKHSKMPEWIWLSWGSWWLAGISQCSLWAKKGRGGAPTWFIWSNIGPLVWNLRPDDLQEYPSVLCGQKGREGAPTCLSWSNIGLLVWELGRSSASDSELSMDSFEIPSPSHLSFRLSLPLHSLFLSLSLSLSVCLSLCVCLSSE